MTDTELLKAAGVGRDAIKAALGESAPVILVLIQGGDNVLCAGTAPDMHEVLEMLLTSLAGTFADNFEHAQGPEFAAYVGSKIRAAVDNASRKRAN